MHSMFSEKGLIYQKLFIDNKCALNTLLLLVWWRKVYIESLGRRTPWVCLLPFSPGSSHYKPCIAGFSHFCSKDKCGKQNQLCRHHFVSLAVRIRNNFVAMKRFRVLIEKKNFFQSESRDQGNFGRNVKLCSILDTHCINRRWYPKFSSQYFPWSYFWSQFIDWFCTSYNYRCNKTKWSTQVH